MADEGCSISDDLDELEKIASLRRQNRKLRINYPQATPNAHRRSLRHILNPGGKRWRKVTLAPVNLK